MKCSELLNLLYLADITTEQAFESLRYAENLSKDQEVTPKLLELLDVFRTYKTDRCITKLAQRYEEIKSKYASTQVPTKESETNSDNWHIIHAATALAHEGQREKCIECLRKLNKSDYTDEDSVNHLFRNLINSQFESNFLIDTIEILHTVNSSNCGREYFITKLIEVHESGDTDEATCQNLSAVFRHYLKSNDLPISAIEFCYANELEDLLGECIANPQFADKLKQLSAYALGQLKLLCNRNLTLSREEKFPKYFRMCHMLEDLLDNHDYSNSMIDSLLTFKDLSVLDTCSVKSERLLARAIEAKNERVIKYILAMKTPE